MGMWVIVDCDLGLTLSHGGGYPGYGSYLLLFPERGVGIFAFANRTYAGPAVAVWDAAAAFNGEPFFKARTPQVSQSLANAYRTVGSIYASGDVAAHREDLAMNFLMDRDAEGWQRDLAELKRKVGDCETGAAIKPSGALSGSFAWRCSHGRIDGNVLLAPTQPPRIQSLSFEQKRY
jgi:hypothetical protein